MSLEEKRKLILAVDMLIRSSFRGTPLEYAQRLKISRSTFYRLIDYMRGELNTPILYCSDERRYVYTEEGMILFGFIPFYAINKEALRRIG